MDPVAILEEGRQDFLDSLRDFPSEWATYRSAPHSWNILECVEHVAIVERRYLSRVSESGRLCQDSETLPGRDPDRGLRLFTIMRSRLQPRKSPATLGPRGEFTTLAAATEAFAGARAGSIDFARTHRHRLQSIVAEHPHFGLLNGAEWIQIMDAHARRHADQVREIHSQMAKKSNSPQHRDRPDLPAHLDPAGEAAQAFTGGTIQEQHLHDLDCTQIQVSSLEIEGSVLERVQLAGARFGSLVLKDVRLAACDLANVRVHRLSLHRVELVDCRLTGLLVTALDGQDTLFENADLRYTQLRGARFRRCEFVHCNCIESDLQNADLTGAIMRGCQLARADLNGSRLQNTDFRGSGLEGMLVGMNDLHGAIVDPAQAMILARVLGLQIQ